MYTNEAGGVRVGRVVAHSVLGILGLIIFFGSWTIVSPQEKAVIVRLGRLGRVLDNGFHFKLPIIEHAVKISVATEALKGEELSYSKDAQIITVAATVNYNVDPNVVSGVYREFKKDYESRLILPQVKEAIKSVMASYTAQGLIDNRPKLSGEIQEALMSKIGDRGFMVSSVAVDNLDFDDAYETAIKEKQVAEQNALKQVNVTRQEEEHKKQEILKAQALSEKTRLEAEALRSSQGAQLVEKIRAEAAKIAAEKWNGVMPTHMYANAPLPFVNIAQ